MNGRGSADARNVQTNAVNGMQNAQAMFDLAASRMTSAAAGVAGPDPVSPDTPDMAEAMVGMMSAQLAYTASAKVLSMTLEHERSVLDLLA